MKSRRSRVSPVAAAGRPSSARRAGCWVDRRILPFATRNETPTVRGEHKLRAPLRLGAAEVMLLTTNLPKILSTIGGAG
jgi:hypothetical protein